MSNPTPTAPRPEADWWRTAAIHQVCIRSFADGDGDGTGDIAGLRSRLQSVETSRRRGERGADPA